MHDYTRVDAAILSYIAERQPCQFNCIWRAVEGVAEQVRPKRSYRVTDARLQSLRKRGLIAYAKGAWSIAQVEA